MNVHRSRCYMVVANLLVGNCYCVLLVQCNLLSFCSVVFVLGAKTERIPYDIGNDTLTRMTAVRRVH